jgi:hypothetical protein
MTDAVTSAVFHPMGGVVATCSGQRQFDTDQNSDEELPGTDVSPADNSLKVWSMPNFVSETEANYDPEPAG